MELTRRHQEILDRVTGTTYIHFLSVGDRTVSCRWSDLNARWEIFDNIASPIPGNTYSPMYTSARLAREMQERQNRAIQAQNADQTINNVGSPIQVNQDGRLVVEIPGPAENLTTGQLIYESGFLTGANDWNRRVNEAFGVPTRSRVNTSYDLVHKSNP